MFFHLYEEINAIDVDVSSMLLIYLFIQLILFSYRVQGQVDEVVGVMRGNMEKVMDRGEKLEDLEDKTGMVK